jgi:hypothetical protein
VRPQSENEHAPPTTIGMLAMTPSHRTLTVAGAHVLHLEAELLSALSELPTAEKCELVALLRRRLGRIVLEDSALEAEGELNLSRQQLSALRYATRHSGTSRA